MADYHTITHYLFFLDYWVYIVFQYSFHFYLLLDI